MAKLGSGPDCSAQMSSACHCARITLCAHGPGIGRQAVAPRGDESVKPHRCLVERGSPVTGCPKECSRTAPDSAVLDEHLSVLRRDLRSELEKPSVSRITAVEPSHGPAG